MGTKSKMPLRGHARVAAHFQLRERRVGVVETRLLSDFENQSGFEVLDFIHRGVRLQERALRPARTVPGWTATTSSGEKSLDS